MNKQIFVLLFAFVFVFTASGEAHAQRKLEIAAAANLQKVFDDEIIPAFAKKYKIDILPTYGATGLLAKQMENGAPYEVFVAADVKSVDKLVTESILDPKSEHIYVTGELVLWSKTLPVSDKGLAILTSDSVTNIAIANPKAAPYGAAAMEVLTNKKIESAVDSKIVYAENIGQALEYAQSGNADVAFTALSLVKDSSIGSFYVVPEQLHAPILQAFAVIPQANGAARRFAQYLLSPECQKIFQTSGYLPPPPMAKAAK